MTKLDWRLFRHGAISGLLLGGVLSLLGWLLEPSWPWVMTVGALGLCGGMGAILGLETSYLVELVRREDEQRREGKTHASISE